MPERASARAAAWVAARHGGKILLLPVGEVWAFESDTRRSYVHSAQGRFEVDLSLREITSSPIGKGFLRVHRSWLASIYWIREMALRRGACCLFLGGLSGEEHVLCAPVSRSSAKQVRKLLLDGTVGVRTFP